MKPSDIISPSATQSANEAIALAQREQRTSYGRLAKFRRVFFRQDRYLQPFWTWFIDNPRPESLK